MTYQIISERKLRKEYRISTPDTVYQLVKRYAKDQEHFILITMNGALDVISVSIISIGLANKTLAHPREVFCKAITDRAIDIIVCHNHVSGSLVVSDEDKELTKRLYQAGEIIGIPLMDHIIFTKKGFISLRREGLFPES